MLLSVVTSISVMLTFVSADLVKSPTLKIVNTPRAKRQAHRFLVDEVSDHENDDEKPESVLPGEDDYSEFNNKPVSNRAKTNLRTVTFKPIIPTYSTPRPVPRDNFPPRTTTEAPATSPPLDPRLIRRVGFNFMHFPYDRMHRFYQLNPRLQFVYPKEYENVEWSYPIERTPYYHQRQFYNLAALGFYGKK
uniref:Conserved secreted protein n=1 Tax=Panagrellus redivivus TaxID=6233 RepID=A0A7E4V391_PANRE